MRSKAHLKGHPVHPMLIPFPIAFFTGAFLSDLSGLIWTREYLHTLARYLETGGIVFALLAAIPGIIDFLFTVPPQSSAKKRAAKHGLLNITTVIVFSTALVLRSQYDISLFFITGLEAIGVMLLVTAGWMGGTLVYRNQIGIDIRYAHAGKWKEDAVDIKGKIVVASQDELKINQMKLLHVNNKRLVVCRTEAGYAVFDDHCTHRGGSLAGGSLICGTVQCPWHGSQFDVQTGVAKAGPAKEKIITYPTSESAGKIFITTP